MDQQEQGARAIMRDTLQKLESRVQDKALRLPFGSNGRDRVEAELAVIAATIIFLRSGGPIQ